MICIIVVIIVNVTNRLLICQKNIILSLLKNPKMTKKNSSSIVENTSVVSTSSLPNNPLTNTDPCIPSTSSQESNFTVPDLDIISNFSTIVGPIVISEPRVELELLEPVSSHFEEPFMSSECVVDSPSHNISLEKDVNRDENHLCIYCDQKTKKQKLKRLPLHTCDKNDFLKKLSEEEEDLQELIEKVQDVTDSKIYYHNKCQLEYSYEISSKKNTTKTAWHDLRQHHKSVFDEVCNFIQENVVEKGHIYFLTYLHRHYMELFKEEVENPAEIVGNFAPHNLESKINSVFKKKTKFLMYQNKKILAPKHVTVIDEESLQNLKDQDILDKAALILRKSVLQAEKNKLPSNLSVRDLQNGEVSVPEDLSNFYFTLVAGIKSKRKRNDKCIRQVQSLSQDAVYAIFNGKYKTSKHIKLGMALKSLTSSRKIIDIIHRYGHCISYPGVEELETEATRFTIQKSTVCSESIKKNSNLCTGVAFDNYDMFVETKTGKDTLHDTVGIIYQNMDSNTSTALETSNLSSVTCEEPGTSRKRRHRTLEVTEVEERSYMKKPKMTDDLQISIHEAEETLPVNLQLYKNIDLIWMLSHVYQLPNLPMWVGYNCLITTNDNKPKQVVSYLTPINLSPTNTSVVLQTMEKSLEICDELGQSCIQVTYDLAIAKVALQIQATEGPKFDTLFIHLGPFHIMMSYFKAIGKFIADCGLSNIMVQSNLLASGSVAGFQEGKQFNRCKRLHPLMSLGLEILHFKSFLEINNVEVTDTIIEEMTRLQNTPMSSFQIDNEELKELLNNYLIYKQQTLNGEH